MSHEAHNKIASISYSDKKSLKPAKVFRDQFDASSSINSLTFDATGDNVIAAGDDETFSIFSCKTGKVTRSFASKKYGIDHVRFTHAKSTILHTSTKLDHAIRLHSVHENKYLAYFSGHDDLVTSLSVSPINDTFLSASLDETVRLWDVRTSAGTGRIHVGNAPVAAYDNQGVVFAVARKDDNGQSKIYFYDVAQFTNGPFITIPIIDLTLEKLSWPPRNPLITSLLFRPNGKHLLVSTSGDVHYVLDAFSGRVLRRLVGHMGLETKRGPDGKATKDTVPQRGGSGEETCWTPDGKYVMSGSHTGQLITWDLSDLPEQVQDLPDGGATSFYLKDDLPISESTGGHTGPLRAVGVNPRLAMVVTGSAELAFWLPEKEGAGTGADLVMS